MLNGTIVGSTDNLHTKPDEVVNITGVSPTAGDTHKAIKAMPNGKAVGRDGIPGEVLKAGGWQLALSA